MAAELREIDALLDDQPEAAVPPEFEADIMRRIRGVKDSASAPRIRIARWLVPLAAGACAVGLALYIGGDQARGPQRDGGKVGTKLATKVPPPAELTASATSSVRAAKAEVTSKPEVAARRDTRIGKGSAAPARGEAREEVLAGASTEPPPDLFDSLDLFVDFPIIWELEKFEHYETIWASSAGKSASVTRGG